jgi:hypothetical protein
MLRKNNETGDERTSNGLSSDADEPTHSSSAGGNTWSIVTEEDEMEVMLS